MVLILIVASAGCSAPAGPRVVGNPDLSVKIPAIKQAAQTRDPEGIMAMIDELSSDDPAVRFYAIEGLRRATGQSLGYRFYDDQEQRRAAVQRWKQWRDQMKP